MNALIQQNEELKLQNVETVSDLPSETRLVITAIFSENIFFFANFKFFKFFY